MHVYKTVNKQKQKSKGPKLIKTIIQYLKQLIGNVMASETKLTKNKECSYLDGRTFKELPA